MYIKTIFEWQNHFHICLSNRFRAFVSWMRIPYLHRFTSFLFHVRVSKVWITSFNANYLSFFFLCFWWLFDLCKFHFVLLLLIILIYIAIGLWHWMRLNVHHVFFFVLYWTTTELWVLSFFCQYVCNTQMKDWGKFYRSWFFCSLRDWTSFRNEKWAEMSQFAALKSFNDLSNKHIHMIDVHQSAYSKNDIRFDSHNSI